METTSLNKKADSRMRFDYPLEETLFHKNLILILRIAFKSIMDLNVDGNENIPNEGPAIVAANHVTNMDVFPMQLSINRPIFFMGKAELFENTFIHYLFRQLGAFPIYRGERDEWALEHARKILKAGNILGMFPEGTRSKGRGLKVARTGAARLSIDLKCPVIPLSIEGSYRFSKNFPGKSKVNVVIGKPIVAEYGELPIGMTDRIITEIARNLPAELRGVYNVA